MLKLLNKIKYKLFPIKLKMMDYKFEFKPFPLKVTWERGPTEYYYDESVLFSKEEIVERKKRRSLLELYDKIETDRLNKIKLFMNEVCNEN